MLHNTHNDTYSIRNKLIFRWRCFLPSHQNASIVISLADLHDLLMNAMVFIHWPVLSDKFTSVFLSHQGSSQVTAQFPWEQETQRKILPEHWAVTPDAVSDRLGWVAHTSVKAGVRSCCLFIFLPSHRVACQPHSFSHSSFLFSLPCIETHFSHVPRAHLLTHILFVGIAPLGRSLAIQSRYFEQQRCTDAALSVCTSQSIWYSCPPTAVTYCNYCTSTVKPPAAQSATWGYCTCSPEAQKQSVH